MNQQGGGGGAGGGGQGGPCGPAWGGFMNDPTTAMGLQVGRTAVAAGQEYMDQHVSWTHILLFMGSRQEGDDVRRESRAKGMD